MMTTNGMREAKNEVLWPVITFTSRYVISFYLHHIVWINVWKIPTSKFRPNIWFQLKITHLHELHCVVPHWFNSQSYWLLLRKLSYMHPAMTFGAEMAIWCQKWKDLWNCTPPASPTSDGHYSCHWLQIPIWVSAMIYDSASVVEDGSL